LEEASMCCGNQILRSVAFESSNDAIFMREVTDGNPGCFIEVNPTACKRLGYTREELLKLTPRQIDASVIDLAQYMERLMAEGCALFRTTHRAKDGTLIPTEINVRLAEVNGKKFAIAIARDLSEREQMERQLEDKYRQLHAEKAVWMSEITYRTIFNSANDAMFLHEPHGFRVVDVNQKACEMFDMPRERILAIDLRERHSPEKFSILLDYFQKTAMGHIQTFEWLDEDSQGRPVWSEVSTKMIKIHGEERLLSVLRDITEHKRSVNALRESESKNKALLEALPDLMIHLDGHGVVMDYRPGKADEIINPQGIVLGRTVWDVMPDELAARIMEYLKVALASGTPYSFEVDCAEQELRKDLEFRFTPCFQDSCLMLVRDITERKQLERQLRHLSLHDSLTGVGNRLHFEQQLTRIQDEGIEPVGVIVCDLDGLKMANDIFGHSYGDQMLVATANVLRNAVYEGNNVCRVGGDEFAILCFESDEDRIRECVKKIRRGVEEYNNTKPPRSLSLSIGYSNSGQTEDILDAYRTADRWMYREKLHRSQSARSEIVQTLLKALEARDFLTEGHCERMERLVVHLGEKLSLPERTINDLSLLAQFHDIGKVGIRDSILFKTGPLTAEEFDEMKQHSEIGYRIAQSLSDLVPIAGAILKHHERWDGTGYPIGLKGEEIPLECRILAIVDAFDAMTNDRPYRRALPVQQAVKELERCSGSQFDPLLVSLFVRMIAEESIIQ